MMSASNAEMESDERTYPFTKTIRRFLGWDCFICCLLSASALSLRTSAYFSNPSSSVPVLCWLRCPTQISEQGSFATRDASPELLELEARHRDEEEVLGWFERACKGGAAPQRPQEAPRPVPRVRPRTCGGTLQGGLFTGRGTLLIPRQTDELEACTQRPRP